MGLFSKLILGKRTRQLLKTQRKNTTRCISIPEQCQTREEIIKGFQEVSDLLKEANDPVAEAAERTLLEADSLPDEYLLRLKDDFVQISNAFLSSTR